MRTMRILAASAVLAAALPAAFASKPLDDALAAIPADAIAFVTAPNPKELDANVKRTITDLGLEAMVPEPMSSPIGLMKTFWRMSAGLDENGAVAFVVLPCTDPDELQKKQAIIVTATDAKALLDAMGGKSGEGGGWTVELMGKPVTAIAAGNRVVFSKSAETAKAVAESKSSIVSKISARDKATLEGMDLALWADAEPFAKLYKDQIDGFLSLVAMANPGSGEQSRKQIEMFVNDSKSLVAGSSAGTGGVLMRMALTARPGTELARQMVVKTTSDSLLSGLPGGKYVLAFGGLAVPETTRESIKQLDPMFEQAKEEESIDKEQLRTIKESVYELAPMITGLRLSIDALPEGPGGLIGATMLVDSTDSGKFLKGFEKMVRAAMKLSTDEEFKKAMAAFDYKVDAEESGGMKIAALTMDPAKLPDPDEEMVEDFPKIFGKDGLKLRIAALDDKCVAMQLGGGLERLAKVAELVKSKGAPLASDAGIKRVGKFLPDKRQQACYIALDNALLLVNNMHKATGEEEVPVKVGQIDAPLAFMSSGEDGTARLDLLIPTELIKAGSKAVMGMMGMDAPEQ